MNQSFILIIDTAHPIARVIIADAENIVAKREWENEPKVGTSLLIYIDELLQELKIEKTDIARIAVHVGPGSSGLVRTGVTTATILAQSVDAELVGITGETEEELVKNARNGEVKDVLEVKYE
jgi:tRNA A37 threonylcarbamoyladenosine modification protein TsaB